VANGVVRDNRPSGQGGGGGGLLLALGAVGLLGFGGYELLKPKSSSSPGVCACGTGEACNPSNGVCGPKTGPAANLPTGLYAPWLDPPHDTIATTWWVVKGVGRWGIPSQTQLHRCWGANPPPAATNVSFGNADATDNEYIGTIGYVSACTQCPPGSPGAAVGA